MSDLESKKREFEERLERISKQRLALSETERSADSDQPVEGIDNFEERINAWEALLDTRLDEHRTRWGEGPALPERAEEVVHPGARPVRPRPFHHPQPTLKLWLEDLDHMMLNELELGNYPLPAGFQSKIQIVDSDQAMRAAIAEACQCPNLPEQIPDQHSLGAFHVPGRGTLLNQEHYARQHGINDFEQGNPQNHAELISEAARERWGWGYMLEYTTLGQNAGAAGLWPTLSATRLGLPVVDERIASLANALRQSWILTEAGWLDWVWQYVMFKAHNPVGERMFQKPRPGRALESLVRIVNLFPLYIYPFGLKLRLRNLIELTQFLFLEEGDILPRTLNSILVPLQKFCYKRDDNVEKKVGLPLSQIMGRLYFAQLEGSVGILSTPYAVLIIGHTPELDLQRVDSGDELLTMMKETPRLNPDTRLAMLSGLDSTIKYDRQAMSTAAWERLHLDGPREYFERSRM